MFADPPRQDAQVARRRSKGALAALPLFLGVAGVAHAGLGRGVDGVRADRAHFAAALTSAPQAGWTVHTLSLANGGQVREFADAEGVVFAVDWRGPSRPDLQQLLGDRFAAVQAETTGPLVRRGRRLLGVARDGLVVRSAGRPGAFHGRAYLTQSLPQGFTGEDLR